MIKNRVVVVDEAFVFKEETHLTVLKTSLFYTGDGFTVYDCKGQLVFRVDTYGPDVDKTELVLMDPSGKCLLTVRRKVFPLFSPSIFIYFVFFYGTPSRRVSILNCFDFFGKMFQRFMVNTESTQLI